MPGVPGPLVPASPVPASPMPASAAAAAEGDAAGRRLLTSGPPRIDERMCPHQEPVRRRLASF